MLILFSTFCLSYGNRKSIHRHDIHERKSCDEMIEFLFCFLVSNKSCDGNLSYCLYCFYTPHVWPRNITLGMIDDFATHQVIFIMEKRIRLADKFQVSTLWFENESQTQKMTETQNPVGTKFHCVASTKRN